MDQNGFFNPHIYDILQTRLKIKNLIHGKFIWQGIKVSLSTTAQKNLNCIFKRPETIFGISFVVLDPFHPDLDNFVTPEHKHKIDTFLAKTKSLTYLQRQEQSKPEGLFTGSYIIHPITKENLPIYVSDYAIELFDMRTMQAHLAVPAHISQDFIFAQKHHLPIKVVVTGQDNDLAEDLPKLNKDKTQLTEAYTRDDAACKIISSEFLNGSLKHAHDALKKYIAHSASTIEEYKQPILYTFHDKEFSIEQLQTVEKKLIEQNIFTAEKATFTILLNQMQADFLEIVEQFLMSVQKMKTIMIDLVIESCQLRKNNECYLLRWSQLDTSGESEKTIFKRDIKKTHELFQFCSDLVDFLGDLGSSCPRALKFLDDQKNKK